MQEGQRKGLADCLEKLSGRQIGGYSTWLSQCSHFFGFCELVLNSLLYRGLKFFFSLQSRGNKYRFVFTEWVHESCLRCLSVLRDKLRSCLTEISLERPKQRTKRCFKCAHIFATPCIDIPLDSKLLLYYTKHYFDIFVCGSPSSKNVH